MAGFKGDIRFLVHCRAKRRPTIAGQVVRTLIAHRRQELKGHHFGTFTLDGNGGTSEAARTGAPFTKPAATSDQPV